MADKKLVDLASLITANQASTDIYEMSDSAGILPSKKETRSQMLTYMTSNIAGSPYVIGDLVAASSSTVLGKIPDVATGNVLLSGGVGASPTYGKVGLATHVSGTLPALNGGTGFSSYAVGDLLFSDTTTSLSRLSDVATGNVIISGGVGVAPSYGKVGLTTHVSGTLPALNGGTGFSSYAVGDLLFSDTTTSLSRLSDVATGNVIISGGVGVAPSYGKVGLTTHISGVLSSVNGGSGVASPTAHGILVAQGSSPFSEITLNDGQLLIGSTGNDPVAANLSAGQNITITNNPGSISISSSSNPMPYTEVTSGSQIMSVNNVYAANSGSRTAFILPSTASIGDLIEIVGKGSTGWSVVQLASQVIHMGISPTTVGASGTLSSTNQYDCVTLRCITANTTWIVKSSVGNIQAL